MALLAGIQATGSCGVEPTRQRNSHTCTLPGAFGFLRDARFVVRQALVRVRFPTRRQLRTIRALRFNHGCSSLCAGIFQLTILADERYTRPPTTGLQAADQRSLAALNHQSFSVRSRNDHRAWCDSLPTRLVSRGRLMDLLRVRTKRMALSTIALVGLLALAAFVAVVVFGSIAIAVVVADNASGQKWALWGNIGQTFESVNAIFSGLAFIALVVTFWLQLAELKEQRQELQLQRKATSASQNDLHCSALADLRALHVELIKMSIKDRDLALVWPEFAPGLSEQRNKQYLFANLVLQNTWLNAELGHFPREVFIEHLKYLFASPLIRDYWAISAGVRGSVVTRTTDPDWDYTATIDAIYEEAVRTAGDPPVSPEDPAA